MVEQFQEARGAQDLTQPAAEARNAFLQELGAVPDKQVQEQQVPAKQTLEKQSKQSVDEHGNKVEVHSEVDHRLWRRYESLNNGGDGIRVHLNGSTTLFLKGGGMFEMRVPDFRKISKQESSSYFYPDGTERVNFKNDDVSIEIKNGRIQSLTRDGKKHNFTYAS